MRHVFTRLRLGTACRYSLLSRRTGFLSRRTANCPARTNISRACTSDSVIRSGAVAKVQVHRDCPSLRRDTSNLQFVAVLQGRVEFRIETTVDALLPPRPSVRSRRRPINVGANQVIIFSSTTPHYQSKSFILLAAGVISPSGSALLAETVRSKPSDGGCTSNASVSFCRFSACRSNAVFVSPVRSGRRSRIQRARVLSRHSRNIPLARLRPATL